MTDPDLLRGDCSRCIGLCCVALSFDRGPYFAFDQPAGDSCRHLSAEHRCRIHERLAQSGMTGCARFDCLGAGQLVTAMFRGLTPGDSPATQRQMFRAFALMREIQLLRRTLGRVGLAADGLEPAEGWTLASLLVEGQAAVASARDHLAGAAGLSRSRSRISR